MQRLRGDLGTDRPDAEAHTVAKLGDGANRSLDHVDRRVVRRLGADDDVPGVDGYDHLAVGRVGARNDRSVLEPDACQPVAGARPAVQQVRAGEGGDERVGWARDQLLRAADLAEPTVHEDTDTIREGGGVLEVVSDEDGGD